MIIEIVGFLSIIFFLFTSSEGKLKVLRHLAFFCFLVSSLLIIYRVIPEEYKTRAKPCHGILGLKLGDKINKEYIGFQIMEYGTGQKDYLIKNYKQFMDFEGVAISTLVDDTIYQIEAFKRDCNFDFFEKVKRTIEDHYSIENKNIIENSKKRIAYKFPNKAVMIIELNDYNQITLTLTSSILMERFNIETTESIIDISALE